jgi:hypothetical protein
MNQKIKTQNPYATNKGGKIDSPFHPAKDDPKATRKTGDDLRM